MFKFKVRLPTPEEKRKEGEKNREGRISFGVQFGPAPNLPWFNPHVRINIVPVRVSKEKKNEKEKKEEEKKKEKNTTNTEPERNMVEKEKIAWSIAPKGGATNKPQAKPPKPVLGPAKGYLAGRLRGSTPGTRVHAATAVRKQAAPQHPVGYTLEGIVAPPAGTGRRPRLGIAPRYSLEDIAKIKDEKEKYQKLAYFVLSLESNIYRTQPVWGVSGGKLWQYLKVPKAIAEKLERMGFDLNKLASYLRTLGYRGFYVGNKKYEAPPPKWYQEEVRRWRIQEAREGLRDYVRYFKEMFNPNDKLYWLTVEYYGVKKPEDVVSVDLTDKVVLPLSAKDSWEKGKELCKKYARKGKITVIGTRGSIIVCGTNGDIKGMSWNEGA